MKKTIITLVLLLLTITVSYAQGVDGKSVFNTNCAACHNMEKKMVGPPLKDVVKNQGREWTTTWIKNSAELIASGDRHANEIYKEYNEMAMPAYEYLSDEELSSVVNYLEGYSAEKEKIIAETAAAVPIETSTQTTGYQLPTYLLLILVLVMLVFIIAVMLIGKTLKLLFLSFNNTKMVNGHLLEKLNVSEDEVSKELEILLEQEVEKRVNVKVNLFKSFLDSKLKDLK